MNESTAKLIEQLAQKLGTTSEYLWGMLLRQAPIDATFHIIYLLLALFGSWWLWRLHCKLSHETEEEYSHYHSNELSPIFMTGAAAVLLMMDIVFIYDIKNAYNGFFNPDFWAVNYILKTLN